MQVSELTERKWRRLREHMKREGLAALIIVIVIGVIGDGSQNHFK